MAFSVRPTGGARRRGRLPPLSPPATVYASQDGGRNLTLYSHERYEALLAVRARQATEVFKMRHNQQPRRIMPKTTLGKWSVGLIVAMPLLFILGTSFTDSLYRSVPAGDTILADIAARPALALAMLAGMGAGASAFITGLLAVIGQKERALLVYVSGAIGALLVVFLAGELLFPH